MPADISCFSAISSPLAEGRELKFMETLENHIGIGESPLAEGRELKSKNFTGMAGDGLVAPRGGA